MGWGTMIDRKQLFARSSGYCERCGGVMAEQAMAAHHRKLRSQGGTDELSNVLAVHHACHNGDTRSIHLNPRKSYRYGYMVFGHQEPLEAPVLLPGGTWVALTDSGSYQLVPGPWWASNDT
jgi:hypothetical protein